MCNFRKTRKFDVAKIFSDEEIDYWFYYGPLFVGKQPNIQLQKNNIFALLFYKQAAEMLLMHTTRELETKQKIGPWKFQWTTFPRKEIRSPGTKKNTWPRRNLSLGPPEDYTIAKTNWATKLDESNLHFYAVASFESLDEVLMCEYSNRSLFFNMKLQNEINDFIFHFECELLLAV